MISRSFAHLFCGDEDGDDAEELEAVGGERSEGEETVDNVDTKKECVLLEVATSRHPRHPLDKLRTRV